MKKRICILGSTGSIGTQALDVIGQHSDLYEAYVLTAYNNADLLIEQAKKYNPEAVVIAKESNYDKVKEGLADLPIKVYTGADALCQVVQDNNVDIVLASMVGFAGLEPTIAAIKAKKMIALANKETLVVAGDLITRLANENQVIRNILLSSNVWSLATALTRFCSPVAAVLSASSRRNN